MHVRELSPEDAPGLAALYDEYEWFADRPVADVRAALAETELALGVEVDAEAGGDTDPDATGERELVAAARVLTDYRYYATVYDVVVAREHRREGVGATLLQAVVDRPDLADLPGVSLLCREGLVPFYESVGFEVTREVEPPEGETEPLVRMTRSFEA